ncbi:hypothetical protein [Flavobacterium sp.]|uniref:hypothetical protein n=1 Tax=Flavobacterium sp. TaxID=239 RepID=UPI00286B7440|nr:hypothetical protein [Flavobacterium sp.]
MTQKEKKYNSIYLKVGLSLIVLLLVLFYWLDYKLIQKDKHKDWTTLETNTDTFYNIHKTSVRAASWMKVGNGNIYLLVGENDMNLVNENGKIVLKFGCCHNALVDLFHNRIIKSNIIRNDSIKIVNYVSYDLKTFDSTSVDIIPYRINETYDSFLKRKKITNVYHANNEAEYDRKKKIIEKMYYEENQAEIKFISKLHPLIYADTSYHEFWVTYYTDDIGNIYDLIPSSDGINNYDELKESWDILYPHWEKMPEIITQKKSNPSFSVSDTSIITGNELYFDSGIVLFSPTGNDHNRPMQMYFEQNYLNYYTIKFQKRKLNFKMEDNIHIMYVEKDLTSFEQLNIPKSDLDTLAFIYNNELYRVYPRKK